jgi:hypothetical protein
VVGIVGVNILKKGNVLGRRKIETIGTSATIGTGGYMNDENQIKEY